MSKKALLVVSFGTSYAETRKETIEAIEGALTARFPDRTFRRAFTSGMILKVLRERDDIFIDNVSEAMEKLAKEGFTDVLVQPTHIINGDEYDKMMRQLKPFRKSLEVLKVGRPLLTKSEDYEAVCHAMVKHSGLAGEEGSMDFDMGMDADTALVLMGHGTGHFADSAYAALDYRFKALGYPLVFVGTVEGYPEIDDVLVQVRASAATNVCLMPLMIVAGDHAINDMAGDEEDSWNTIFKDEGYEVSCLLKGMGAFKEIQDIFVKHAEEAE